MAKDPQSQDDVAAEGEGGARAREARRNVEAVRDDLETAAADAGG